MTLRFDPTRPPSTTCTGPRASLADAPLIDRRRALHRPGRRRHDPARHCARYAGTGVPVFAVNFGEIGFLATIDPEDDRRGRFRAGVRRRLRGPHAAGDRARAPTGAHAAINDVSIHRKVGERVAQLAYASAARRSAACAATASSLSTPAGSTGYNLANGGPVLAWGVEGYVVSFIAPHSLTARALVVAPGRRARRSTNRSPRAGVEIVRRRPARRASWRPATACRARFLREAADLAQVPRLVVLQAPAREVRPPGVAVTRRARAAVRRSVGGAGTTRRMLPSFASRTSCSSSGPNCASRPGLNVLTGETGAGKTVLAHALDLLLGGRARAGHRAAGRRRGLRRGRLRAAATRFARDAGGPHRPRRARSWCWRGAWAPTGARARIVNGRSAAVGDLRDARRARCVASTASTSTAS